MGSTLEHGIYLPSEGERNCYSGLANNWQAVDTNIGYVTALRQAIAGTLTRQIVTQLPTEDIDPNCIYMVLKATAQTSNIYDEYMYINSSWELIGDSQLDLSNYYTKQEVNQLPAVASGVTATKVGNYDAHIANGDIHVTASDKSKWTNSANTHVLRLAKSALTPSSSTNAFSNLDDSTALKVGDKVMDTAGVLFEVTAIDTANSTFTIGTALIDLAVDSSVVHNSGNEDVKGTKTFKDMIPIDGDYLGDEASSNQRTNICLRSNRDTAGKSGAYITRFRQNKSQGALQTADLHKIGFDVLENGVRTNNVFDIQCTDWLNDVPHRVSFVSSVQSYSYGHSTKKALINGLNPGSLSLPDLSNGIDISGYLDITQSSQNYYTPPVDGWISIRARSNAISGMAIIQNEMAQMGYTLIDFGSSDRISFCALPVKAGVQVGIWLKSVTTLDSAKFFPCLGNV